MKYTIKDVWRSLELYNSISSLREEKEARLELIKDVADIPKKQVSKLVVASGSYDPLTIAHSALFQKSLDAVRDLPSRRAGLEQLLILTPINHVHKKVDLSKNSALQERYGMTVDFAAGKANVAVGMVNTGLFVNFVPLLEGIYGKEVDIYFVCGTDLMQKIADPVFYNTDLDATRKALYNLFAHRFIVTERSVEGRNLDASTVIAETPLLKPYEERILKLSGVTEQSGTDLRNVSSTLVRNLVKEGKSFEHLIADVSVVSTIKNLELYKESNSYHAFVCAVQSFADLNKGKKIDNYFGVLITFLALLDEDEELREKIISLYNAQDLESLNKLVRFFRGEKKS